LFINSSHEATKARGSIELDSHDDENKVIHLILDKSYNMAETIFVILCLRVSVFFSLKSSAQLFSPNTPGKIVVEK
jgi:hypothetical protein